MKREQFIFKGKKWYAILCLYSDPSQRSQTKQGGQAFGENSEWGRSKTITTQFEQVARKKVTVFKYNLGLFVSTCDIRRNMGGGSK